MKTLISIIISAVLLSACNNDQLAKKKKELESLKTEAKATADKIKLVEAEIAKLDTTAKKEKLAEVSTVSIAPQVFKTYIDVQGRIDADENVALSSQMPGTITKINVSVGDKVSKGQILAETDASAVHQQMSDLQTNLDLSKQLFQKQQNLWNQKIGTEIQYLQAKATKESLEKKMNLMQEQLRMTKIISPINGTVDAVNIKLAQQIMPGMNAITVVNFSNLKVKADVAETYSSRIKNGNEVLIYFPDTNDSLTSKVNYASRAISPLTRTFGVEVLLSGKKEYHPNMVAKLKINDYKSAKPEIIIPIKFIQKDNIEKYVLVEENGIAVKKAITIDREYNGYAQVTSGLKEGDRLISEGYDLINEGDKITVKK